MVWTWLNRDVCLLSSQPSPIHPSLFSLILHNMHSSKKKKAKKNIKSTKPSQSAPSASEIQRFFHITQLNSPELMMTDTRAAPLVSPISHDSPTSPAVSSGSEAYPDIPPAFLSDPQGSPPSPSLTYHADTELRSLLQALPTKADIEALIGKVKAAHRQELQVVKKRCRPSPPDSQRGKPRYPH